MSDAGSLELVRRLIEAFNARDVDAYLGLCGPDVELHSPISVLEGAHVGADGVRAYFAMIAETTSDFTIQAEELRALDDGRVLAQGQLRATSQTGIEMEIPFVNIYEVAGERLRRVRIYLDRDEGFAAAGLAGDAPDEGAE